MVAMLFNDESISIALSWILNALAEVSKNATAGLYLELT
jgi:hypothetical protein